MNTPTHFLMTAAIERGLPRVPIVKSAFLWGSVAPDLPLWVLSIAGIIYYHFIQKWSLAATFHYLFDQLYFHNPFWIASHNFLHSPVLLLILISVVGRKRRTITSPQRWWFWFFMACLLHSFVDIFTHADDGPLLLFPFEWTLRFPSPVSYWDHRYYGKEFGWFEKILDVVLILYLSFPWMMKTAHKIKQFCLENKRSVLK